MTVPYPFGNLERGHYGAILVDPPTRFETYSGATEVTARGSKTKPATTRYATMTRKELAVLPVGDLAAPNCVLFLWSCWPTSVQTYELIERWGFKYKTCAFAWMKVKKDNPKVPEPDELKPRMGLGYWTRANTEICLLATRGHPKRLHRDVPQAIIEPRREHSRKPDCVYPRIERLVAGPYVELFARQTRAGWDSWGDQVTKFNTAQN
jgi:N6-adenosine-specific RNA methylase IME4